MRVITEEESHEVVQAAGTASRHLTLCRHIRYLFKYCMASRKYAQANHTHVHFSLVFTVVGDRINCQTFNIKGEV